MLVKKIFRKGYGFKIKLLCISITFTDSILLEERVFLFISSVGKLSKQNTLF